MPHIVNWKEQLKYVRPDMGRQMTFFTPKAIESIYDAFKTCTLNSQIEVLETEEWFCQHMTDYISDLISIKVKEDP